MNTTKLCLAAIGAFALCCVTVRGQAPLPVLEALPTAETLGAGWSREISLLFDPVSKPSELFAASSRLPESFKKENREAVQNPTNRISGWSHTHFTFHSTNASHHYDVQVERYRSKAHLRAEFDQLLAFDSAEYRKVPVDGIGEAAVFFRKVNGGATVWFRRADFRVWIASMGTVTNWDQDVHLQDLVKEIDQRIARATTPAAEPPRSGERRDKS
jgi:hypothetical protein